MSEMDKEGIDIFEEFERYSKDRFNWESHWKEIAERFIPSHSKQFSSFAQSLNSHGEKRTEEIFDSTPSIALGRFASILDSLLTPRNSKWQMLKADSDELNKVRSVKLWFEEVTRLLFKYRYAPRSNFANQNNQVFKSIGGYGTGALFIDDMVGDPGMRYKSIHLSELYLVENHQGIVDKCFRHFKMRLRAAHLKFGDALPEQLLSKLDKSPNEEHFFLHRVQPNMNQDAERLDARGMAFESVYISVEGKKLLSRGGYNTFPYPVSRYEQASGEIYGRSPAMETLPSVKTLNEEKKTVLKQGHRTVDPVILAHDDGILDTFSLAPGAVNPGGISADGRPLVTTLPVGNIAVGKDLMDDERQIINDAFFITLFQILVETPSMTATEVMERIREKGVLLSPTLGRQESEYLAQMTERELDILSRQGVLPEMPPELLEAAGEYKIVYDSPLARAQRAEEAAGLMRTVETAMNVAGTLQDPSIMDHFDWDTIIPEVAGIHGVPTKWMKSFEMIAQERQERAEAQQRAEAREAAPGQAALLKAGNEVQKTA